MMVLRNVGCHFRIGESIFCISLEALLQLEASLQQLDLTPPAPDAILGASL
jgi:hypothetical protein